MKTMHHERMRGWTLPVVMLGTALLLGWIRLLTLETSATGISLPIISQGEAVRAISKERLALNIPSSRVCEDISIRDDTIETSYTRCSEGVVPFVTQPPFPLPLKNIDYDAIFSRATVCSTEPMTTPPSASHVPKSLTTCVLQSRIAAGTTLLDNIKAETVSLVTQKAETTLMASPGSITIMGTLSISQDVLIIGGGDIDIGVIHNTSDVSHRVTIMSSLGSISVGRVIGNLSLLVAGRSTLQTPETPQSTSYPLPPLRDPSLRGFASRSFMSPF